MTGATGGGIPRLAIAAVACVLALSACDQKGGAEQAPVPGDKAVAKVDGKTVWASDVKREAIAQGLIGEGEPLDVASEPFHQVMDEVIDRKLLAAEAVRLKLDRDPAAQRRLAASRERILGDLLVEREVSGAASENAVRGLYQEQMKLARQSEQIRARQILVASQAEAAIIKAQLASGAAFEALAMERSIDAATRFNGGDLGFFTTDIMPQAYETALKAAKTGDIVGPIQVDGGWAILRVEDRKLEDPITLEAARPQIVRYLTFDRIKDLLERLRGHSKIQPLIPPPAKIAGQAVEPAAAPPPSAAPPVTAAAPAAPLSANATAKAEGMRK